MRVVGYLNYLDNIWECFSISYLEIFEDGTQLGLLESTNIRMSRQQCAGSRPSPAS